MPNKNQKTEETILPELSSDNEQYSFIDESDIIFPTPAAEETENRKVKIRYTVISPFKVQTLSSEENARYMTADQMRRLTDNLKNDNALTSAVLLYPDSETNKIIVISGNHRVEAARNSKLEQIPALIIQTYLNIDEIRAIQLSHNAITGQDNPNVLLEIYESLSMQSKAYSGITDDFVNSIKKIDIDSLSIGTPKYEEIILHFLPPEKEAFMDFIEKFKKPVESKTFLLAEYKDFENFFNTIVEVKEFKNIFNTAVAINQLAELALERLNQLKLEQSKKAEKEKNSNGKKSKIHKETS